MLLGGHAHVGPGPPVDAQGRQSLAAAGVGQGVHEGVGGGVVPLAGRAQDGGGRREKDEEIQRPIHRLGVQVPGPRHLGSKDAAEALLVELDQEAVVEEAGRMDNAPQRRQGVVHLRQDAGQSSGLETSAAMTTTSAPAARTASRAAASAERRRRGRPAAGAAPLRGQPAGHGQTESPQAAVMR